VRHLRRWGRTHAHCHREVPIEDASSPAPGVGAAPRCDPAGLRHAGHGRGRGE
jgi:hypothetical protein